MSARIELQRRSKKAGNEDTQRIPKKNEIELKRKTQWTRTTESKPTSKPASQMQLTEHATLFQVSLIYPTQI